MVPTSKKLTKEALMLTLLFMIIMFGVVGRLIGVAFKMSWGLVKILFTIAFWPVILLVMVLAGLIQFAFTILIVIGLLALFTSRREISQID